MKTHLSLRRLYLFIHLLLLVWATTGAQNPITVENRHEGTNDWLLTKIRADTCHLAKPYTANYFCRQRDIEGYCSKMSVAAGDTLAVFVSTLPASSFSVEIYRMGYYGGTGARKM